MREIAYERVDCAAFLSIREHFLNTGQLVLHNHGRNIHSVCLTDALGILVQRCEHSVKIRAGISVEPCKRIGIKEDRRSFYCIFTENSGGRAAFLTLFGYRKLACEVLESLCGVAS